MNTTLDVMNDTMLTTIDNPYSPFVEWDDWYAYDVQCGYNTCAYLARVAKTADTLPDKLNEEEIDRAMQEIVDFDTQSLYIIVNPSFSFESLTYKNNNKDAIDCLSRG